MTTQLKIPISGGEGKLSTYPVKATSAAPTTHNCCLDHGPASSLNHRALQIHETSQNSRFASIWLTFAVCFCFVLSERASFSPYPTFHTSKNPVN